MNGPLDTAIVEDQGQKFVFTDTDHLYTYELRKVHMQKPTKYKGLPATQLVPRMAYVCTMREPRLV